MKALIIGGTGKLSGRLAELLLDAGAEVTVLTRGSREAVCGVKTLTADRNDTEAFSRAILGAQETYDAVYDCICMTADHAREDLEILPSVTGRLVVVSTDSVYDPERKRTPQNEEGCFVDPEAGDYAGNKRAMELAFLEQMEASPLQITIFRPGHIYGAQFELGCYPEESRKQELPERLLAGEAMRLVASGIYLIHPIFVDDLAKAMIDCTDRPACFGEIFCIGGPEAVENRLYYEYMAEALGVPLTIEEIPLAGYLKANPGYAGHLNHRIYDLTKLERTGVPLPATHLREGLFRSLAGQGYSIQSN